MDKTELFNPSLSMENPDCALLYYYDYRPVIAPGIVSEHILKGPMQYRTQGYLLLQTSAGARFAVEIAWTIPFLSWMKFLNCELIPIHI